MKMLCALIGGSLVLSVPAQAQDAIVALDPTVMAGWSGNSAPHYQTRRNMGPSLRQNRVARARPVDPAAFRFRPDSAVRQKVHARLISQVRKSSPAEAGKMAKELNSGEFTRGLTQYLGRYNMSPTNLADTTSLYLATAWLATRASSADPSPGQMQGLRRQVTATLASMPAMASATNATKQEWAEASLIQAALASAAANEAARNPSYAAKARNAVAKGVKSLYQIDLLSLDLTNQGLQ